MQSIEELLNEFGVPHERSAIVRLARALHRMGIKRRNTRQTYWIAHGVQNCNDARDLVTFARYLSRAGDSSN